ncbi:CYTH domain protein [archaeon]|nr:CYTH domain protein [archaeon]
MIEVEIKVKANNPESIRKRIAELNGSFIALEKQFDIYFNHPCRDFGTTDEALRLRKVDGKVELTYKGEKIDAVTKTREELIAETGDFESVRKILMKLGFSQVREVVKERKVYSLGEYLVMIDSVEGLGKYVEVEKKSSSYTVGELIEFIISLGLNPDDVERKSYLELLLEGDDDS